MVVVGMGDVAHLPDVAHRTRQSRRPLDYLVDAHGLALAAVPAGGTPTPPKDPCKANPGSCTTVKQGRMTGHGHYIDPSLGKVQWEFRNSICGAKKFPDLKVEWGGKRFS